jgi:ATP-dependent RNA helicase RhlE
MCDMGFMPDIRRILKLLPTKRQTLFFSATMPKEIRTLADDILNDPITVQIGMIAPAKTVSHALYPVPPTLKKKLLFAMLQQMSTDRVLVFTRTKHRARGIARDLDKRGYRVSALQGNMGQNQRQNAINGFKDGRYDILVATDIAARGIDVAEISHVINFDMPDTADAYTHRIGRTGRAHQSGDAFTFAEQDDRLMVQPIEKVLGTQIERRSLPGFDYGDFVPESQFKQPRANQPVKVQPHGKHKQGSNEGNRHKSQGRSKHKPSQSHISSDGNANHPTHRHRSQQRKRFSSQENKAS